MKRKLTKSEVSQKFNLKELLGYEPSNRQKKLFFDLAVDKMVERTVNGRDIDNRKFKPYTKSYAEFKGVSRGSVDLVLSGDMLNSFEDSQTKQKNIIKIAIEEEQTGKAHGNITGSYGKKSGDKSKARDFFGFKDKKQLSDVLKEVDSLKGESPLREIGVDNLAALRAAISEIDIEAS